MADRGHRHTTGISEVTFHISHSPPRPAVGEIEQIDPSGIPERSTEGVGPRFGRARHVEQVDMQYPEPEWVQPHMMHYAVLDQTELVNQSELVIPDAEQLQYPVDYCVLSPVLHQIQLEQSGLEHTAVMSANTSSLSWEAQPLSFVSLPIMGLLSVLDGLPGVCISRAAHATLSPVLAVNVRRSGGTVEGGSVNYDDEDTG